MALGLFGKISKSRKKIDRDKVSLNDIIRKAAEDSIEYAPGYFDYKKILCPECEEKRYDVKHILENEENLCSTIKHLLNVVHFAMNARYGKHRRYVKIRTIRDVTSEDIEIEYSGIDVSRVLYNPEYNTQFTIAEDVSKVIGGLRNVVEEELKGSYTFSTKPYRGIKIVLPANPIDDSLHIQ